MTQALEYHEIAAVFESLGVPCKYHLLAALADAARDKAALPIPMVLYCPNCGVQHIDAPETEPGRLISSGPNAGRAVPPTVVWDNPPHRSHKCKACDCVWRPADVATTGVDSTQTEGKADTWPNGLPDDARAATARFADNGNSVDFEYLDSRIRELFLANGFTIKDGQTDLKPYVYRAAHALLFAIGYLKPFKAESNDDQAWDRQAEALTQAAGLGGGKINPNATSVMDLFLDDDEPPPPYPDCRFRHCDLPGQCTSEGKCHHPKENNG